jgi:hypothetical protein
MHGSFRVRDLRYPRILAELPDLRDVLVLAVPDVVLANPEGAVVTERTLGIDKARPILGDLATGADRTGQTTILTLHHRPLAAIVSLREAGGRDLITEPELEEALRVLAVRTGNARTHPELARAIFGYVLRARGQEAP